VPPYGIAIIYAGLNDKDRAFDYLNKAYEARSIFLTLIRSRRYWIICDPTRASQNC